MNGLIWMKTQLWMDGELVKMETNDCMNNGELINRDGNQQRMDDKQ